MRKLLIVTYLFVVCLLLATGLPLYAQYNEEKLLRSAREELLADDYTQAIVSFNRILRYKPENIEAYLLRGIAKYELSDNIGAEMDFSKAYELDSFRTSALYYLAILNIERNQFNGALKLINNAIRIDDRYAEYFVARGWVWTELADTNAAINDFNKAISLEPNIPAPYINLAYINIGKKKYDEALKNSNKAIKLDPDNLNWYLTRGHIYQQQKEYDKARKEYDYVLSRDTINLRALYFKGICYAQEERFGLAVEEFNKVIGANPNNASVYYYRGLAKYELKQYSDAVSDFDRVLQLNNENIYAFYARGLSFHALGKHNRAESDFSQVIELYPKLPDVYRIRAQIRYAMNDLSGYLDDRTVGDTLMARGVPDFSEGDFAYLKQITSFRSDFTPVKKVVGSKVQYASAAPDFLGEFILLPQKRKNDGLSPGHQSYFPDINLLLDEKYRLFMTNKKPDNTDTVSDGNYNFSDYFQSKDIDIEKYDTITQCILLAAQNKYMESNSLIEFYQGGHKGVSVLHFVKGNNFLALGDIIQSIESKNHTWADQEKPSMDTLINPIVKDYYTKAITSYSRAIELHPDFLPAFYNRALAYAKTTDYMKAFMDLTFCIASENSFATAYFNRGLVQLLLGNRSLACRDLSQAGELGIQQAYTVIYYSCN